MSIRLTILAATAAAFALAAGCAAPAAEARAPHATRAPRVADTFAADTFAADTSFSVYDLGATWRDQHDATRTLAGLRGRPQVIAMIYTHCSASCPLTVSVMKRVEAAAGGRVGLVLVSLDPARDDAGRLAAYAAEHALDDARWTLLRGSDDAVRDLAATLGVRYRRASADELAHTNTLTVVDANGVVVHQTSALGDADGTIAAVRQLLR